MRMNCWTAKVTRYRFINLVGHDLSQKKKEKNDDNINILWRFSRIVAVALWVYYNAIIINAVRDSVMHNKGIGL